MTCDTEWLLVMLESADPVVQIEALRVCAYATLDKQTILKHDRLLNDPDLEDLVVDVWNYFRTIDHNHATLAECDYLGLAKDIVEGDQIFEALWYDDPDCDEDAKRLGDRIKEFRKEWWPMR